MTQTKVCSKCGVEKEVGEFHANRRTKDGKRALCKACVREHNKARYAANREYFLRKAAAYKDEKREIVLEKRRMKRAENLKEARRRAREWRKANGEKVKAADVAYYAQNRDRLLEKSRVLSRELHDRYVISTLKTKNVTPELIQLKREQLEIHRLTKQLNKLIKEKNNGAE